MVRMIISPLVLGSLAVVFSTTAADAQCGSCGVPTTRYSPVSYQVYRPVTYQVYRAPSNGGCCITRFCDWLWGRTPTTVVASYAPACDPCATTCARPVCATCPTCCQEPCCCPTVSQTSYQPVACPTCGTSPCSCGARTTSPSSYASSTGVNNSTYAAPSTYTSGSAQQTRSYANGSYVHGSWQAQPTSGRELHSYWRPDLKPPVQTAPQQPSSAIRTVTPSRSNTYMPHMNPAGSSTRDYESPRPQPRDRTARQNSSPVRSAFYVQSAPVRNVAVAPQYPAPEVTLDQAQRDASYWASPSR